MIDFWKMYKMKINERFELEKSLANSESDRQLINFEIILGMHLLRPRPETEIFEETADWSENEFTGIKLEEISDIS